MQYEYVIGRVPRRKPSMTTLTAMASPDQPAATPDSSRFHDDQVIERVLRTAQVWAIVGLSNNASRAAYRVSRVLQSRGKRIIPVHPSATQVHGERGYATLSDALFEIGSIDVVEVFVNSALAGSIVDEAIAIGASAVWLQLGVIDYDAAARASAAGLDVVMDRCPDLEWPRLLNDR